MEKLLILLLLFVLNCYSQDKVMVPDSGTIVFLKQEIVTDSLLYKKSTQLLSEKMLSFLGKQMKEERITIKEYGDLVRKTWKMRNKLLISILFFYFTAFLHPLWGQEKINHLVFTVKLNKSKDNNQSHYNGLISNIDSKLKEVSYDLNFTTTHCKFTMRDNALSEEDNSVILDITDMLGRDYFTKANCDTVYAKNEKLPALKGQTFFSVNTTKWFITLEKKVINGYECTKAFTTLQKDYGDGEKVNVYDAVAWFCPEIEASFGPKGFMGLPGMILELEQPIVTFTVSKLDYTANPKNLSIDKNKSISEAELFSILHK